MLATTDFMHTLTRKSGVISMTTAARPISLQTQETRAKTELANGSTRQRGQKENNKREEVERSQNKRGENEKRVEIAVSAE